MDKYVCTVCQYVYDPAENGGIKFEDLPDDWVCPLCGVGKDMFEAQQPYNVTINPQAHYHQHIGQGVNVRSKCIALSCFPAIVGVNG